MKEIEEISEMYWFRRKTWNNGPSTN